MLKPFVKLIKSASFLEKFVLLLITAGLTGLLVPEIAGRLEQRRFREQKTFEADLQRQRDVLTDQTQLLRNLSRLAWDLQLMNINVSFYKSSGNESGYHLAAQKYQERSAELLGQIRAELSTARRLVSPEMQEKLSKLYYDTLLPIDANLERLIQKGANATPDDWKQQHHLSLGDAQVQIDNALTELAAELKLTATVASADNLDGVRRK